MNNRDYYLRIESLLETNIPLWQATVIQTDGSTPARMGMKACIGNTDLYFGNLGGGEMEHNIIDYVREHRPKMPINLSYDLGTSLTSTQESGSSIQTSMICGGQASVFIEPLHLSESLYIIGGGHCGKALAQLAQLTGYSVMIIDDRQDVLEEAKSLIGCRTELSDYSDMISLIKDENPSVVIMTHGHANDKAVLEQCLDLECKYLGMIGSKKKVKETFDRLLAQGINADRLARVHAPIGLPIGSQTPYEIAISIMAELIRERSTSR